MGGRPFTSQISHSARGAFKAPRKQGERGRLMRDFSGDGRTSSSFITYVSSIVILVVVVVVVFTALLTNSISYEKMVCEKSWKMKTSLFDR
jgi:hypothetical protein